MWSKIFLSQPTQKLSFFFSRGKKNLYRIEILGVDKNASQPDLKKAYYKLAQTHHPDKCSEPGAKDKFAQINGAYQVLSDEKRRQMYDQTGSTQENPFQGFQNQDIFGQGGMGGMGGMNMGDFQSIFGEMFGMGNRGQKRENGPEKVSVRMDLQFMESVNGAKKTINYHKKCVCATCNGSKSKPGTQPQKCGTCQGSGFISMRQGPMILRAPCNSCHGEGKKITNPCTPCKGTGVQTKPVQQQIVVPRGIQNETVMRIKGKGSLNGDLQIRVFVKSHPTIKRVGVDAHTVQQISIIDAVLGCDLQIKTIYGDLKKVKVQAGVQNGHETKLNRQGFYRPNSTVKGNHVVTIKVKVPTKITEEEKHLYEQLKKLRDGVNKKQKAV